MMTVEEHTLFQFQEQQIIVYFLTTVIYKEIKENINLKSMMKKEVLYK